MATEQHGNDVEILQLDPQPVLSIRTTIAVADLAQAMGAKTEALSAFLQQRGIQPSGAPFVRYHTFGETETDFEFGIPVVEPVDGEGQIVRGELPGGPALTTSHTGPHEMLGAAYARIHTGLKEHNREPRGPAWEVYYWLDLSQDGASSLPDSTHGRTQLVQPIKEA